MMILAPGQSWWPQRPLLCKRSEGVCTGSVRPSPLGPQPRSERPRGALWQPPGLVSSGWNERIMLKVILLAPYTPTSP